MSLLIELFKADPLSVLLIGFIAGAFSRYPRVVLQLMIDVVTNRLTGRQKALGGKL